MFVDLCKFKNYLSIQDKIQLEFTIIEIKDKSELTVTLLCIIFVLS